MSTLSAPALNLSALNLSTLVPLAVVAGVIYLLQRGGMQLWHAIVCLALGVILAGTVFGPVISTLLSQLSGGHLH